VPPTAGEPAAVVPVVDADDGADAVAGATDALVRRAVVHPGGDAGPELPGAAAVLDEQLGRAPCGHEDVVVDQKAGAGPVVFGVAEQLDAADAARGLLITSANERGGPDPATLDEVPGPLRSASTFAVDGGRLAGMPSSVIDVTTTRPRVLRSGPGLERALEALLGEAAYRVDVHRERAPEREPARGGRRV